MNLCKQIMVFCCRLTGVPACDGRRARLGDSDSVCVCGVADGMEVPILHGPSAEHRAGHSDPKLGVAAAAGVGAHPPPDSPHAHPGRCHSEESAGKG